MGSVLMSPELVERERSKARQAFDKALVRISQSHTAVHTARHDHRWHGVAKYAWLHTALTGCAVAEHASGRCGGGDRAGAQADRSAAFEARARRDRPVADRPYGPERGASCGQAAQAAFGCDCDGQFEHGAYTPNPPAPPTARSLLGCSAERLTRSRCPRLAGLPKSCLSWPVR